MMSGNGNALRVGLAGCGPRAVGHAQALAASTACRLAACADIDADRGAEFGRRFAVPHVYPSVAAMLHDHPVDLLVVATPAAVRRPVVDDVLTAGTPPRGILVEKPIAVRAEEGYRILDDCREAGVALFGNHQLRYFPPLRRFRDEIASGTIGRIRLIRAATKWSILEHGSHLLDLVGFLFGDTLVADRVLAQAVGWADDGRLPPAPHHTAGIAIFHEGPRLYFECGRDAPTWPGSTNPWHQAGIELIGTDGTAGWSLNRGWWCAGSAGTREERYQHETHDDPAQAALFDSIAVALSDPAATAAHPAGAVRAAWSFQIIMAALRAAAAGTWVEAAQPVADHDLKALPERAVA